MKTKVLLFVFAVLTTVITYAQDQEIPLPKTNPFAEPGTESRGVFGEDDRKEVSDVYGMDHFVRATAVMIDKRIVNNNRIYGNTLRQKLAYQLGSNNMHEDVKFLDQPAIAGCTGFLIAPDILVSAGHCLLTQEDADKYYWLFDYTNKLKYNKEGYYIEYDDNDLFEVKEVLAGKYEGNGDLEEDYVVMRLDRKTDRLPYRIRTSGKPEIGRGVYTIGSPTGLPLKVTTNSEVLENNATKWFKSSTDAFGGNSGGPVFDPYGYIEGILVRGAVETGWNVFLGDYKYDFSCDCIKTVKFENAIDNAGCEVHKINEIPGDILVTAIYENLANSIKNRDYTEFERWKVYSWMFDKKYLGSRQKFENMLISEVRNSMTANQRKMLIDMLAINSGKYSQALEYELVRLIFDYQDEELFTAAEEYLNLDVQSNGKPLIWKMTKAGNQIAVQDLLEYGANYQLSDINGNNLLHIAAQNGDEAMARILIEAGVDLDQKNNRKWRPEKVARKSGFRKFGRWLKRERRKRD